MKQHSRTVYQESYKDQFPWTLRYEKNETKAFCTFCKKPISVENGGRKALTSHQTKNSYHKMMQDLQDKQNDSLTSYIIRSNSNLNITNNNSEKTAQGNSNSETNFELLFY